jgi:hypothetical protein
MALARVSNVSVRGENPMQYSLGAVLLGGRRAQRLDISHEPN